MTTPRPLNPDALGPLFESLKEMLRLAEAAMRDQGMWTEDNPRVIRARAALALALAEKGEAS